MVSLNGQLPRYFIHAHYGERPLAVFAAMAYVMVAGVTFLGSLNNAAMPRLARHYAERDFARFRRVLGRLLAVACGAGAAGVAVAALAGRQLLTILYRPEYAEHHTVFVWVMVAAAVAYVSSVLGFAVTATRAFGRLTLPYVAGTVATLAGCWVLVPRYGLTGAAWAVAVSGVAGCAAAVWVLVSLRREVRRVSGRAGERVV
jgi:O-antigen/teichoic acid export membrane protein